MSRTKWFTLKGMDKLDDSFLIEAKPASDFICLRFVADTEIVVLSLEQTKQLIIGLNDTLKLGGSDGVF